MTDLDVKPLHDPELEPIELALVLRTIRERYGFDFEQYSQASLTRRVRNIVERKQLNNISELIPKLLHEPAFVDEFVNGISVSVTEPFRDAEAFRVLRERIVPVLRTYPFFKIWHAGCASGEEVYSMAIVLHEEGLLDRVQLYATDINTEALARARDGICDQDALERAEAGYVAAGGTARLTDYYSTAYGRGRFAEFLRRAIVFSQHNLVTDGPFGEMVMVVCRNVMIYFDRNLQERALRLFCDSLGHRGFLMLGGKESLQFLPSGSRFEIIDRNNRIYRAL